MDVDDTCKPPDNIEKLPLVPMEALDDLMDGSTSSEVSSEDTSPKVTKTPIHRSRPKPVDRRRYFIQSVKWASSSAIKKKKLARQRYAGSTSPVLDALIECLHLNLGVEVITWSPNDISLYINDLNKMLAAIDARCQKKHPTQDRISRIKALDRWFTGIPRSADANAALVNARAIREGKYHNTRLILHTVATNMGFDFVSRLANPLENSEQWAKIVDL
jgi:hypothetical protein